EGEGHAALDRRRGCAPRYVGCGSGHAPQEGGYSAELRQCAGSATICPPANATTVFRSFRVSWSIQRVAVACPRSTSTCHAIEALPPAVISSSAVTRKGSGTAPRRISWVITTPE